MSRTWRSSLIVLSLLAIAVTGVAQDKPNPKQAFLDGKEAGPDFQLQGEYVGKVGSSRSVLRSSPEAPASLTA